MDRQRLPDWRDQSAFGTAPAPYRGEGSFGSAQFSPISQIRTPVFGSSSYKELLPDRVLNTPMRASSQGQDFLSGLMGQQPINNVVNIFGSTSVGKVYSGAGYGQFTAAADAEIQAAAQKYGVPANFLKAIVARESSGDWNSNNRVSNIRPSQGGLLPYVGVFKSAADSRGLGHLWRPGDRAAQTELLAGVLRSQYDQLRKQNPAYNWINVASYHFSGKPVADGWSDELGMSNNQYVNKLTSDWKLLDSRVGQTWNPNSSAMGMPKAPASGGQGGSLQSMFGGAPPRISQEMGLTDFAKGHLNGMYSYGNQYGITGHAGIDYSMNPGTKLYAPTGGTVIKAGGSGYYRDDRYGNRVGTGELRLKLDNGDEVILGHMGQINVPVGTRVAPGQFVGLSGTAKGGHVHLEYRKWVGSGVTPSGFQAVDPRQQFMNNINAGKEALAGHYAGDGHAHGGGMTSTAPQPFINTIAGYAGLQGNPFGVAV